MAGGQASFAIHVALSATTTTFWHKTAPVGYLSLGHVCTRLGHRPELTETDSFCVS